jgi:RNA polymerase sigma factor (sigma-70 family)
MIGLAETPTDSERRGGQHPRYSPDQRTRTASAAARALAVARWVRTGRGLNAEPDEHALFAAMHTCAYRAARHEGSASREQARRSRWTQRWVAVREHIVERNLGLAHWAAARFTSHTLDEDELLSEALFALARAVEGFNPWMGFRFSTYAVNVIVRTLVRREKRETCYRRVLQVQYENAEGLLERPPRLLDSQFGLPAMRLQQILAANIAGLSPAESQVLAHRFPMDNRPSSTLQQVSEAIGLSKERVRQIQKAALCKLHGVLAHDPILR